MAKLSAGAPSAPDAREIRIVSPVSRSRRTMLCSIAVVFPSTAGEVVVNTT